MEPLYRSGELVQVEWMPYARAQLSDYLGKYITVDFDHRGETWRMSGILEGRRGALLRLRTINPVAHTTINHVIITAIKQVGLIRRIIHE